ncbi:unnamed protein product [Owenia fusiformis]|uniref:DNA-directed DNA polymerase n=1 Tax=Owenia fusiformis TaxID=6347 RepID=A0A8S4QA52_OWEFU|nr:unnamed protein product [Owenia fusiformis]
MTHQSQLEFDHWYQRVKEEGKFNYTKGLAFYCKQDVRILAQSFMKYRNMVLYATSGLVNAGIDPLSYLTNAQMFLAIFRSNFLREYHTCTLKNLSTRVETTNSSRSY